MKAPLNSLYFAMAATESQLHTSCSVCGRALSRCYRIRVICLLLYVEVWVYSVCEVALD